MNCDLWINESEASRPIAFDAVMNFCGGFGIGKAEDRAISTSFNDIASATLACGRNISVDIAQAA